MVILVGGQPEVSGTSNQPLNPSLSGLHYVSYAQHCNAYRGDNLSKIMTTETKCYKQQFSSVLLLLCDMPNFSGNRPLLQKHRNNGVTLTPTYSTGPDTTDSLARHSAHLNPALEHSSKQRSRRWLYPIEVPSR